MQSYSIRGNVANADKLGENEDGGVVVLVTLEVNSESEAEALAAMGEDGRSFLLVTDDDD